MRLVKARVQNYRSIHDSGLFDVELYKTIIVGVNEAGKTALLEALQKINPPEGIDTFDALRDYPRSKYNDITTGKVKAENILVVEGHFSLEANDIKEIPDSFQNSTYVYRKYMNNRATYELCNCPTLPKFSAISADILRLVSHVDGRYKTDTEANDKATVMSLKSVYSEWLPTTTIDMTCKNNLWLALQSIFPLIEEGNEQEENRYNRILSALSLIDQRETTVRFCKENLPVFIMFNNIFRVKPLIHLEHLANRVESKLLDDDQYDYGNLCLLKLLGFTSRDLSNLGKAPEPLPNNLDAMKTYRDQLDKRSYQLNAASVMLTQEIIKVWNPKAGKPEANRLRVTADGQYLKVVVEDDLGVEIELNQRSEGFQWLVSFFIVFFAEATAKHANAILLLDEPGLSLHGLKQREFRTTISRLAENNQTLFTTHSPFLVGPDELNMVRVVEMTNRTEGTKVHTTISAGDSTSLLPLQEALGYDLAQSLFMHQKNLVLEGLTDYWYIESISQLLSADSIISLDSKISLIPASSASKVVYFATLLHANDLKVAALLDSDNAGDLAASQETLVNILENKRIIRTKDVYSGEVKKPEIEDILRTTLVQIAKVELGWNIEQKAESQPKRPIIDIFTEEIKEFSKYKLAKSFINWSKNHRSIDLPPGEVLVLKSLIERINKALK